MSLPVQQDYFAVAVGRRTGVFKTRVAISEKNFGLAGRTPVRNNFLVASPAERRSDAGLPDLPEFRNSPDPRIPRFSEIPRFSKFPGNFAV